MSRDVYKRQPSHSLPYRYRKHTTLSIVSGLPAGSPFFSSHIPLLYQHSAGGHGYIVSVRHHNVVNQLDIHGAQGIPDKPGGGNILLRRQRHAAGMVVGCLLYTSRCV